MRCSHELVHRIAARGRGRQEQLMSKCILNTITGIDIVTVIRFDNLNKILLTVVCVIVL